MAQCQAHYITSNIIIAVVGLTLPPALVIALLKITLHLASLHHSVWSQRQMVSVQPLMTAKEIGCAKVDVVKETQAVEISKFNQIFIEIHKDL